MLATAGCKIESPTLFLDLRRAVVAPIMKRSVACEWSIQASGVFFDFHVCFSHLDSRNAGNCFRRADIMPCIHVFGSMQPTLCRLCFTSRLIGLVTSLMRQHIISVAGGACKTLFRTSLMSSCRCLHIRYRSLVFLLRCLMTHDTTIPCTLHLFHTRFLHMP